MKTTDKAERLINLITYLLNSVKPVTSRQIRETIPGYSKDSVDAFQRMFERDKEALREMGIPLELIPDPLDSQDGYTIPPEKYRMPDLDLAPDELGALWLAGGLLGLTAPSTARAALLRLGELPDEPQTGLSWLAADMDLTLPGLERVFQAVVEGRRINFKYASSNKASALRTLEPYGLVHRQGSWYIVGRDRTIGEIRNFRLDRVDGEVRFENPSSTSKEFDIPDEFEAEAGLRAPPFVALGEGGVKAVVEFNSDAAWRVENDSPWIQLRWQEEGSARAEIEVSDKKSFVSWVLGFADEAEVLSPDDLRQNLIDRLEAACG